MSTNIDSKKYEWVEASEIAQKIVEELRPFCKRIEVAGSIRRKKAQIGDIEIVAIPKPYQIGALEDGLAKIVNRWPKVRGELKYGKCKYTQRILPSGIKLDLFFAKEDNWGNIFAVRTGSAEYSYRVLACGWVKAGFKSVDGYLTKDSQKYPLYEEEDLFKLIGIPYVPPEDRNL